MASSHHNSSTSTPVLLLGMPFNTISHFSNYLAYPPNAPRYSRQIHQRGRLSLRSPSSTIQPGQTVLPISGPSIVPVDINPNWKDTPATNSITNLTANRPISSTHSQSKPHQSDSSPGLVWGRPQSERPGHPSRLALWLEPVCGRATLTFWSLRLRW